MSRIILYYVIIFPPGSCSLKEGRFDTEAIPQQGRDLATHSPVSQYKDRVEKQG